MTFDKWIDTFVSEKGIADNTVEVEGNFGMNIIPLESLIGKIKLAPETEKASIKEVLIKIDFANGDPLHFFKHLAKAIAI